MTHSAVAQHYGQGSLTSRLPTLLDSAGITGTVDWTRLAGLDQFHARGLAASQELAAALSLRPGDHVLDIGSGVGGPARFLAATFGVRVTGIDLTPDFVSAAQLLSERAGLADRTHFQQGDALHMPFPEAHFDHAWTQHVSMNIADKAQLYREVHRVLKPAGRLALYDVIRLSDDPPIYPLPWAQDPSTSFVASIPEMRSLLTATGFRELSFEDTTPAALRWFAENAGSPPEALNLGVLVGPEWPTRIANFAQNLRAGKLGFLQAVVETIP